MDLHLNYQSCPLDDNLILTSQEPNDESANQTELIEQKPTNFKINQKLRWGGGQKQRQEKSVLEINEACFLANIPKEAHDYKISGRSPLEWAVDSLKTKYSDNKNKNTLIDDPNSWPAWQKEPAALIDHLKRLSYLSVKTSQIVAELPPSLPT